MGNTENRMNLGGSSSPIKSIANFKSKNFLLEDIENGLCLNNYYLPEDIVVHILSFVNPKEVLKLSLVCKQWCHFTRSRLLWVTMYERKYNKRAKKLPWFVYYCLLATDFFDTNLLQNGNGQEQFKHWEIQKNNGDEFKIEAVPAGAEPLPLNVPEFNGRTSCFATSFGECNKFQIIPLDKSNLFPVIMDYYKPHIHASEWVAGRFDCGCVYTLRVHLLSTPHQTTFPGDSLNILKEYLVKHRVDQWQGKEWIKMEIHIEDIPDGVRHVAFEHEGRDTQFWKGHYGSKMAGGVVKILFDSIIPKENDIFLNESIENS